MKLLASLSVALVLAAVLAASAPARAEPASWLVFDLASGRVIDQKDAFRPWYPASVTKLMTAYVTFREMRTGTLRMHSPVIVSANALAEPPSKMALPVGTVLTVENALKMVIVKSANDMAVALGEAVSRSEDSFVLEMNAQARRLGMSMTNFNNPNGLPDPGQVTSARDIGLLTRAIMTEFPEHAHLFEIAAFQFGKHRYESVNKLLERYPGANGMKTGFICDSGYNMVASARRNGRTMVAVVFGASSGLERAVYAAALLEKGFARAGVLANGPELGKMVRPSDPGVLPPEGYCRTVPKPTAESLLLSVSAQSGDDVAFAALGRSTVNSIEQALSAETGKKSKKKKARKITADQVLDLLVGTRTARQADQVELGLPDGIVAIGNVPTPPAKPGVTVAAAPSGAVRQVSTAQPAAAPVVEAAAVAEGSEADAAEAVSQAKATDTTLPWPKTLGGVVIPQPRPTR